MHELGRVQHLQLPPISETGEDRHFKVGISTERGKYEPMKDKLLLKGTWAWSSGPLF